MIDPESYNKYLINALLRDIPLIKSRTEGLKDSMKKELALIKLDEYEKLINDISHS